MTVTIALDRRFAAKLEESSVDGCWYWTAALGRDGYGRYWLDGGMRLAHRVAYELLVGPVPDGLTLDHLCRNRACVNPSHLEPATLIENIRRGVGSKTHCINGHPYANGNLYVRPRDKARMCRTCRQNDVQAFRNERKVN